jgi:hypothetical protein
MALYEFRHPAADSGTRVYLGWSGMSWTGGMELYYSDQRISGMEPDASRGIHHVKGAGIIRHIGSVDTGLLREPHGCPIHHDDVGDVVVLARKKLFLFEKLHVVVNGTEYRGHEVLDIHR